jgi:hypothetical protein
VVVGGGGGRWDGRQDILGHSYKPLTSVMCLCERSEPGWWSGVVEGFGMAVWTFLDIPKTYGHTFRQDNYSLHSILLSILLSILAHSCTFLHILAYSGTFLDILGHS